jgi:hypothetical protein
MDKKDTNRFERRSQIPINRGKQTFVKDICSTHVSNYFTSVKYCFKDI